MKKRIAAVMLMAAGAMFGQVSVSIAIGAPPPPRVVRVLPRSPGPDFVWIPGYWYPVGHHYKWHDGYYTRPPYAGARWIEPRHDGRNYYTGFWQGDRGRFDHDHKWDKGHKHDRDHHDR
jgi:hypothetical protein